MNIQNPCARAFQKICADAIEGDEFEKVYTLGNEIGKGSFGVVFKCSITHDEKIDSQLLEQLAVKVYTLCVWHKY